MNKQKKLLKATSFLLLFSLSATLQPISASAAETNGTLPDCDIQWSYNDTTDTLILTGNGNSVLDSSASQELYDIDSTGEIERIELYGISEVSCNIIAETVYLGEDLKTISDTSDNGTLNFYLSASDNYEVSPENPYYAAYDGALYNKKLTELIRVPSAKQQLTLEESLEKICGNAFLYTSLDSVVIPWGVTEIEDWGIEFARRDYEGLQQHFTVYLPDTVRSLGRLAEYSDCRVVVSGNSEALYYPAIYAADSYLIRDLTSSQMNGIFRTDTSLDFYQKYYGITPNSFKTFGSKTYYFDADCKMVTGTQTINGKTYTFDQNGVLQEESEPASVSGLVYQDGKAYIYDEDGNMLRSGWYQADGNWYYLNDYGAGVVSCWRLKDGKYVYLGADGKMQTNCWIKDYNEWYYVKADGTRYESAWAKIDGSWYWFGGSGKMMSNGWLKLADGKWYYFRSDGQMATGWIQDGGKWYYLTGSGAMAANKWVKSGSYWYYLGSSGAMLTNTTTPDGYHVDSEGRWV